MFYIASGYYEVEKKKLYTGKVLQILQFHGYRTQVHTLPKWFHTIFCISYAQDLRYAYLRFNVLLYNKIKPSTLLRMHRGSGFLPCHLPT